MTLGCRGPLKGGWLGTGKSILFISRLSHIAIRAQCYHRFMFDWSSCEAVERHPERVSGAWVFRGTRVSIAALFENLEDGVTVEEFVQFFPGVSTAQLRAVLEHAARSAASAV